MKSYLDYSDDESNTFDVELEDGRIAHCWQALIQEYSPGGFSAGVVDGIPPDTLYLKVHEKEEGGEPTYLFLRPDEAQAIIWVLSGALWSTQMFDLDQKERRVES
jgi:hypothetical protein